MYLYALAAAGQPGVEKALGNMRAEIERDMKLMGVKSVSQLSRNMLRFRTPTDVNPLAAELLGVARLGGSRWAHSRT